MRTCLCGDGLADHAKEPKDWDAENYVFTTKVFTISGACLRCPCDRVRLVADEPDVTSWSLSSLHRLGANRIWETDLDKLMPPLTLGMVSRYPSLMIGHPSGARCICGHADGLHDALGRCRGTRWGSDAVPCTCGAPVGLMRGLKFQAAKASAPRNRLDDPAWWLQFDRPQGAGKPEVH